MTLNKLHLISLCVPRNVRRLVNLVELLKDKVVCSIIFADDYQSAALFVIADVDLASRQTGRRRGDAVEALVLALESCDNG
jgi:hypothetical protein